MATAPIPPDHSGRHRTDAVTQLRDDYGIGRAAASATTDDDLLRLTAAAARRALGASSVSIERVELDHGSVVVLVNEGDLAPIEVEFPEHEIYPLDEYLVARVMEDGGTGLVVSLDDLAADPTEIRLLRDLDKYSSVQVPIRLGGKVWGILFATRSHGMAAFDAADLELAQAVASQVAAGLAVGAHVRRVSELALLDSLTGLASRAAVEERLQAAVNGHVADGRTVSVVICDVNGLKRVNDERGHPAGDRLLMRFGELLGVTAARLPGALAGRLGGDEFCLVVEHAAPDNVIEVVTDLCRRAASLPGGEGVACGIASTADDVGRIASAGDLVRLADGAQYRAKRNADRMPVVAGRTLALPPPRAAGAASGSDRRTYRSTLLSDVGLAAVVEETVELLDDERTGDPAERLALVGDAVSRLTDAASWWISEASRGGRLLTDCRHGTYRAPRHPGADRERFFTPETPVDLEDYPETLRATRGGWFNASIDDEAADPSERAFLVSGGYTNVVGAGGPGGGRDWLLEIYLDADSGPPPAGLGPALRALVALALSGQRRPVSV
jgi:diguanylate cyclase (GGDEF)-like protein